MRGAIRAAVFAAHRYDAGCPKSGFCALHAAVGKELPCGPRACHKFVGPRLEREPTSPEMVRVRYLVHLESMVNVGCKFGPNDLDPQSWEELICLAMERSRIDRLVTAAKDREREGGAPKATPAEAAALRANREQLGVPAAGQSLLPPAKRGK